MEDTILSSVISDLEQVPNSQPLSLSTLENLQSLLDTDDSDLLHQFFSVVPSSLLLPPLTSAMDSSTHNHTHLSLLSSLTYLSLLLSPHSPTLSLFSPLPFLSLLHSLRSSLKKHDHNHRHPSSSSREAHAKNKKAQKKRNARNSDDENENDNDVGGREVFDLRLFLGVVEKLGLVLDLVHLNRFPDCLKSLISTTVEIPVLASEKCGNNADSFNRLVDLCIKVLYQVLKSEHGEEEETAVEVFKALTPLILGGKSQGRNFALGFVKGLVAGVSGRSDGVQKSVANLPRYLVHKAPEKAEPRGWAVEAMIEIVKVMEPADQIGFAGYVVKMTQGKPNLRLLGVDLILNLMMILKDPFGLDLVSETKDSRGFSCLRGLIQRCLDSNAGIRSHALSNLAHLVGFLSNNGRNCVVLKEVMGLGEGAGGGLNDVLRKRCMDEKANVRRAVLFLTTKLTSLLGGNFDRVVLKTMGMACSDPLESIRKAAISALSEAFRRFSDDSVTVEWLHSVPRLISDNESSIQEECESLFEELVLNRISRAEHASTTRNTSTHFHSKAKSMEMETDLKFPEGILTLLKEMCNGEVAPWVRKICTRLGKKNRLKPRIASALQSIIRMSESHWLGNSLPIEKWTAPPGAWFLLSEVSQYLSRAIEWKFLHHHWKLLDKYRAAGECRIPPEEEIMPEDDAGMESNSITWAEDRVFLLQTISNVAVELPPEPAAELAHNLLKRIEEFNMHSTEANAHVTALRTLCNRKALSTEQANTLVMKVVYQVLSKACRILEKYISRDSKAEEHTFLTPPSGSRKGKKVATVSRLLAEAVTAVYTVGSLVIVCPSADMGVIVSLLHTIITSGNSDPNLSKLPGSAPSLYIQAWLAMGKICLADGKLAKSYIPLFVQELEKSHCAALRNNIVVMMADFCVRYTALIDCYISKITRCLRDPCELVRRQTFILLSRLLQRDYVKWRGVLFLRFLLPLVDESEKIRQLADFLIGHILKVKAPLLAYNSFVEAIFVLNDCNTQNGSKNAQTENRLFSIRGNDETSRSKRMHIYVSLLKQMAPEHLLATFAKLCAEILAAASVGMLKIDDVRGQSALQDAFQILSCKEIRIPAGRGSQTDADMEEEGGDGASAASAKGRAITQPVRKSLIQNTIPIFIELKRLLESKNSPLIGSLMECLRILLKYYKNEIDDILIADKQLQKELIYDIQKYESNKAKSTAAEAVATMQQNAATASAAFVSPGDPKFTERVASAMADAVAAATARSVLREMNRGTMTPPLSSVNVPKLKSTQGGNGGRNDRPLEVLESLRRRQSFNSDDENSITYLSRAIFIYTNFFFSHIPVTNQEILLFLFIEGEKNHSNDNQELSFPIIYNDAVRCLK